METGIKEGLVGSASNELQDLVLRSELLHLQLTHQTAMGQAERYSSW